jgi:hypothetical protein
VGSPAVEVFLARGEGGRLISQPVSLVGETTGPASKPSKKQAGDGGSSKEDRGDSPEPSSSGSEVRWFEFGFEYLFCVYHI